jgi:hypothetical protein
VCVRVWCWAWCGDPQARLGYIPSDAFLAKYEGMTLLKIPECNLGEMWSIIHGLVRDVT